MICKTLSDTDGQMENGSWINVLLSHRGKKIILVLQAGVTIIQYEGNEVALIFGIFG